MAQHPGPATRLHDAFHLIVEAVRRGLPPKAACYMANVSKGTFYRWMRYGEQEIAFRELEADPPPEFTPTLVYEDGTLRAELYGDFYMQVLRARAEVALEALGNITEAGKDPKCWPANAWLLERSFPDDFAQTTRTEVTGRGGGPIEVVSASRQEEMARRVLEQAAMRKARQIEAPRELPDASAV